MRRCAVRHAVAGLAGKFEAPPDTAVQFRLNFFRPIHLDRLAVVTRARSRFHVDRDNPRVFACRVVPMNALAAVFRTFFYLGPAFAPVAQNDYRVSRSALELYANGLFRIIIGAAGIEHRNCPAIFDFEILPPKNLENRLARWLDGVAVKKQIHDLRHWRAPGTSEEQTWWALLQKKLLQRRQLVQHRFSDSFRQFSKQALEALDNVEQCSSI